MSILELHFSGKLRRSLWLFSVRLSRALRRPLAPVVRLDHRGHHGADDEDEGEAAVGVAVLLARRLEDPLGGHRADDAEDLGARKEFDHQAHRGCERGFRQENGGFDKTSVRPCQVVPVLKR